MSLWPKSRSIPPIPDRYISQHRKKWNLRLQWPLTQKGASQGLQYLRTEPHLCPVAVNTLTYLPSCQLAPCLSLQSHPCCPCSPCPQSPRHHSFLSKTAPSLSTVLSFPPQKVDNCVSQGKLTGTENLTSSNSVHSTITWNVHTYDRRHQSVIANTILSTCNTIYWHPMGIHPWKGNVCSLVKHLVV